MNLSKKLTALIVAVVAFMALAVLSACEDPNVPDSSGNPVANVCTITFDANGGSVPAPVTVKKGESIVMPETKREGHDFLGWYADAALSGQPIAANKAVAVDSDRTYYAGWEVSAPRYSVTLDLKGGALNAPEIQLKAGDVIYDAVSSFAPTKKDHEFGAWYYGDGELARNARMPATAITLTAVYKVGYKVELYKKSAGEGGYELDETLVFYEYAGKTVTYDEDVAGFSQVNNDGQVVSLVVSERPDENVLKYYYERSSLTLTLNSNFRSYDEEIADLTYTETLFYGDEYILPTDLYSFDGYFFLGWANSRSGDVVYGSNVLDNDVYNGESGQKDPPSVKVERNVVLYALWQKGYTDMFGGDDYLYVFDGRPDSVYLERGGVYFVGEYDKTGEFYFYSESGDIVLFGRLNGDGTFCYNDVERADRSYALFRSGSGLDESVNIYFDAMNGVKYSAEDKSGITDVSEGTYSINDGEYVITYTKGSLKGSTMTVIIGQTSVGGKATNAFRIRNDREVDLGELTRFTVYNGNVTYYYAYQMTFNGYGVATYYTATDHSSFTNYNYVYDEEKELYILRTSSGSNIGSIKLYTSNGKRGYLFYNEALDHEYVGEDGSKLTLDGYLHATYEKDSLIESGYYSVAASSSLFASAIIDFYPSGGDACKFLLTNSSKVVESVVTDEHDEEQTVSETVYTYSQVKKDAAYTERFYQITSGGIVRSLVFTFESADDVNVYITIDSEYVLAASGKCVKTEKGSYILTISDRYLERAEAVMGDLNDIAAIEFYLGTFTTSSILGNASYDVHVWDSYTDVNDVTHNGFSITTQSGDGEPVTNNYDFKRVFTSAEGETLTLRGAFLTYTTRAESYFGQYYISSGLYYITTDIGYLLFEIDEENESFLVVQGVPYTATVAENGYVMSSDSMRFDGKGGATYVATETENETTVSVEYVGTYQATVETSLTGYTVYTFSGVAEGGKTLTFKYITVSLSSGTTYVFKYNEAFSGMYASERGGTLSLDGFGFVAEYDDGDNDPVRGFYFVDEGASTIVVQFDEGNRYFDFDGRSFTVKGEEYGSYLIYDNVYVDGRTVSLDGYGKATVSRYDEDAEESVVIADDGEYFVNGDEIVLSYTDGAAEYVLYVKADVRSIGGTDYKVLVVNHKDVSYTFVNKEDWSILSLDAYGKAVRITDKGVRQEGTYVIITDSLFYFVTDNDVDADGPAAAVYCYDVEKGTASTLKLRNRGYYTEDLEAFRFTSYGVAVLNNETRYYYNIDEYDNVTIYRRDFDDASANEYGFVADDFGAFDNVKQYGGKTFYQNDGFRITFRRDNDDKENYPIPVSAQATISFGDLQFAPLGSDEFAVRGSVYTAGGAELSATIVRALTGDGYDTYIYYAPYYVHIQVSYKGVGDDGSIKSTYRITGVETRESYYAYNYYYYMMLYYYYFGTIPSGVDSSIYGLVTLSEVYDKQGEVAESKFIYTYGASGGIVRYDGAPLSVESGYELEGSLYRVEMDGEDGHKYALLVYTDSSRGYFTVVAYTRIQTFETEDHIVVVERLLSTDYSYSIGGVWSVDIYQKTEGDPVKVEYDGYFNRGGRICFISRTTDDGGTITASRYYYLTLQAAKAGDNDVLATAFESCRIETETGTVYYSDDSAYFMEVSQTLGALVFGVRGEEGNYANEVIYESEKTDGGAYTIALNGGAEYSVSIVGGHIVVNEIPRVTYVRQADNASAYIAIGDISFVAPVTEEYDVRATVIYNGNVYRGRLVREKVGGEYVDYIFIDPLTIYIRLEETAGGGDTVRSYSVSGVISETRFVDYYYYVDDEAEENKYGTMTVTVVYDENGRAVSRKVSGEFFGADGTVYPAGTNSFAGLEYEAYEYNEESCYYLSLEGGDGYEYRLYFSLNTDGYYRIIALTRYQRLAVIDYFIDVETVVVTEHPEFMTVGNLFNVRIYSVSGGETKEVEGLSFIKVADGRYNLFIRTEEDDYYSASEYYYLDLEKVATWEQGTVRPYFGAKIAYESVNVFYVENSANFVEISPTRGVVSMTFDGVDYAVETSYYDEASDSYAVTLVDGRTFKVSVRSNFAVVEQTGL